MPSSVTIRIVAGNIDAAYFYRAVIQSMEALVNDVHTAVKGEEDEAEILSMDVKGKVVTWDALNTQKETVEAVIRGEGDYVAGLKGNHPLFYKELQEYFSEERMQELEKEPGHYKKTVEKEHGGLVTREYYQTDETGWYEDKKKWKVLATFGMVKKKLENILSALSADAIKAALYKASN